MCGIAGWFGATHPPRKIAEVLDSLVHRGPDGQSAVHLRDGGFHLGYCTGPSRAVLLSTRLAIIDLSDAAAQPMRSADGKRAMAYNGETYNFQVLRAELRAQGWRFRSSGDTEVVFHALQAWGTNALPKLAGMFAFAYADIDSDTYILARDHAGIKPLYKIALKNGGIAFASEIPTLVKLTACDRQPNSESIIRFVVKGETDAGPDTMLSGIEAVRPGEYVIGKLSTGQIKLKQLYYDPESVAAKNRLRKRKDAIAAVREAFIRSVKSHLVADVPMAITLSGGIDSTAILGAVRSGTNGAHPIRAYSFVANRKEFDELPWARVAAVSHGATPMEVRLGPDITIEELRLLHRRQAEPVTSLSVLAQWAVFKKMREDGYKVALGGQGADELFMGYPGTLMRAAAAMVRQGRCVKARSLRRIALRGTHASRLGPLRAARAGIAQKLRWAIDAYLGGKGAVAERRLRQRFINRKHSAMALSLIEADRFTDLEGERRELVTRSSLPRLLRYEDRNAMAWSIENRVPFCSREMFEVAFAIDATILADEKYGVKGLLREALSPFLPPTILERTVKYGFFVDDASILRRLAPELEEVIYGLEPDEIPGLDLPLWQARWRRFCDAEDVRGMEIWWRWLSVILSLQELGVVPVYGRGWLHRPAIAGG